MWRLDDIQHAIKKRNDSTLFFFFNNFGISSRQYDSLIVQYQEHIKEVQIFSPRIDSYESEVLTWCYDYYESDLIGIVDLLEEQKRRIIGWEQQIDHYNQGKGDDVLLQHIEKQLDSVIRKENETFAFFKIKEARCVICP